MLKEIVSEEIKKIIPPRDYPEAIKELTLNLALLEKIKKQITENLTHNKLFTRIDNLYAFVASQIL